MSLTTADYVEAVRALGPAYRGDDETLIERVAVVLEDRRHAVKVLSIRSLDPGEGNGTRVLARLCRMADEHGVTLMLEAAPLDRYSDELGERMATERLRAWYHRHGFRGRPCAMIRRPRLKSLRRAP